MGVVHFAPPRPDISPGQGACSHFCDPTPDPLAVTCKVCRRTVWHRRQLDYMRAVADAMTQPTPITTDQENA